MSIPDFATHGLRQVNVSVLLSDPVGGVATYGDPAAMPGLMELSYDTEYQNAEAYGSDAVHAVHSQPRMGNFTLRMNRISHAALAKAVGGDHDESGSTPNQESAFTIRGDSRPPYIMIQGRSLLDDENPDGDSLVEIYKAKITGVSPTRSAEAFGEIELSGNYIPRRSDSKMITDTIRETGSTLPTAADTTPPTVSVTSPVDAGTDVAVDANVTWTFSEALRPSTVGNDTFKVIQASDGSVVAGVVSYDSIAHVVTFNPSSSLAGATAYIALATTGVRDVAGNKMAADSVINFTTA